MLQGGFKALLIIATVAVVAVGLAALTWHRRAPRVPGECRKAYCHDSHSRDDEQCLESPL